MKDGFTLFDSDMHVLEPVDRWERYAKLGLDDTSTRRILWDSCARLYGFPAD